MMEEEDKAALSRLIDLVGEISAFSDYRTTVKKQYTNLARRLKLLTPMFEEIRDCKEPLPEDSITELAALSSALESAKELLRSAARGAKFIWSLGGIADLTQESLALHEMVGSTGGDPEESIEKMSMLLKKVKDFVHTVNLYIDSAAVENSAPTSSGGKALTEASQMTFAVLSL